MQGLGLSGLFSSVKGWKPGIPVKPDPAILLLALKEMDVQPDEAVMVGDSINDLLAARAARSDALWWVTATAKKRRSSKRGRIFLPIR